MTQTPPPRDLGKETQINPIFLFLMVITIDKADLVDLCGYYADDDDDGGNHDVPHP